MKKTTQRFVIKLPSDAGTQLRQTARARGLTISQVVLRYMRNDSLLASKRAKPCSIADIPLKYNNLADIVRGNKMTKAEIEEWDNLLAEHRRIEPDLWK